jgi:hypothetical protein
MRRLRLYDLRTGRLPSLLGKCQANVPDIAQAVNTAQRRLLYARECSDESWWGTWAEVRINVSRAAPYVTLPREIARLEAVTVCDKPIPVFNAFYEYLQFGNGRMPHHNRFVGRGHRFRAAYTRNNVPLFTDLMNAPQLIAVFATNPADMAGTSRVLLQGLDQNGNQVISRDGANQVQGVFVTLASPFITATTQFSLITGVQKDITQGPIQIFQMDPVTGVQILLLVMEPGEQTASYRRYYFNHLPCSCCPPISHNPCLTTNPALPPPQVTALVKLDLIPVVVDTDYCLIQNEEAIIEECQSARYSEFDNVASQQLSSLHHMNAIRYLTGELGHFNGVLSPSVGFFPFGSARLEHVRIGMQ